MVTCKENGGVIVQSKCFKCPETSANIAFAVFGVFGGIIGLVVYIKLTLASAGDHEDADGVKSIALSFIQIITLLTTFPIAWPAVFTAIFQIGGKKSSFVS